MDNEELKQEDVETLFKAMEGGSELTKEQKKLLKKLEKQNYEFHKDPIRRKSVCDVYRNNKIFLKYLSFNYSHGYMEDEEILEKFGAKTKAEADELFAKANTGLPHKWFERCKKYYESFRAVFTD